MVFLKIPHPLQIFAENLIKILKHASLHKKWVVLAKSMGLDGFSQNPTLLPTFC